MPPAILLAGAGAGNNMTTLLQVLKPKYWYIFLVLDCGVYQAL
jgi:hypothetical protein